MGNAISVCFKKYATFEGRANRSEFWYFYLFYIIILIIGSAVETAVGIANLSYLFIIPLWLPQLAVSVRRMHDVDRSGWFILVPIYNLILLCTASSPGSNKYGDL
jgi:uncharacterized membrane protein YhaH (DUF805 family)